MRGAMVNTKFNPLDRSTLGEEGAKGACFKRGFGKNTLPVKIDHTGYRDFNARVLN
jgi:hypothetical protein